MPPIDRRTFMQQGATLGAGAIALATGTTGCDAQPPAAAGGTARFRHSVTRWPFQQMPLVELARTARRLGIDSVELLEPAEWAVVQAEGVGCAVGYAPAGDPTTRLTVGWNRAAHHPWLLDGYAKGIEAAARAKVPNVICFSGNRAGQSDDEGLDVCARGLTQLMPVAERESVTVVMELLNSKVDHPDYQCDHTRWGAELVKRVNSPRFRLLYDIYHMQIMEGDVIRTIRDHKDAIAHFHTAGVPGRHELDATQELQYPAIMRAIADTGFTGYVAQEFIPTRDPVRSLEEAVRLCRV